MKTQGRSGEVAVEVHSDVPDRFKPGMRLLALQQDERRRELNIEAFWPHKQLLVLKFAGVDSISEAELLVGCELQIPREERAQLDPGWTYISDLMGCKLFDREREIGIVEDVRFGAGEAPLLVVNGAGREYEVPYAQAYLKRMDLGQKRIDMALPEGILDVNAPMTAEEKQHHRETGHAARKTRRP